MDTQATNWPLASAFFGLLLALGELIAPARGQARVRQNLRAFLLAALSLVIVHGTLLISGRIVDYPWFFGWQSPGGYLMAPAFYFYARLSLDPSDDVLNRPHIRLLSIAPGAAVAGYAFWQMLAAPEARLARIAAFYSGSGPEHWIIVFGFVYFFAYMLAVTFVVVRRLAPGPSAVRSGLVFAIGGGAISAFGFAAMLSGLIDLLRWTVYGMAAFVPALYLVARRSPDLLTEWLERVDRRVPENRSVSRLQSVDVVILAARLEQLMQNERMFTDEDLSLAELARAAGITPHQLSEFLNQRRGTSFFHYVNDFRVREACRLLLSERERTVLSIAYAVGFNSKSAFQRAFSRHTGLSPREYRRASLTPGQK